MKKKCLLSLILLYSTTVFSQNPKAKKVFSWGARLGANMSIPKRYTDSEMSHQVGIYLENNLLNSSFFDIRGELLSKMTRVDIYTGTVQTWSIELPVSLKFSPKIRNRNLGFFVGLAPSVPVFSETYFMKITNFKKPINLGYFAGVSLLFPSTKNKFGLDFRYCGYWEDNYNYGRCSKGGGCYTITDKLATFEVSLTYNFW